MAPTIAPTSEPSSRPSIEFQGLHAFKTRVAGAPSTIFSLKSIYPTNWATCMSPSFYPISRHMPYCLPSQVTSRLASTSLNLYSAPCSRCPQYRYLHQSCLTCWLYSNELMHKYNLWAWHIQHKQDCPCYVGLQHSVEYPLHVNNHKDEGPIIYVCCTSLTICRLFQPSLCGLWYKTFRVYWLFSKIFMKLQCFIWNLLGISWRGTCQRHIRDCFSRVDRSQIPIWHSCRVCFAWPLSQSGHIQGTNVLQKLVVTLSRSWTNLDSNLCKTKMMLALYVHSPQKFHVKKRGSRAVLLIQRVWHSAVFCEAEAGS